MTNLFKLGLSFVAGLAIGAVATAKFIEYKNNKEIDENITEVEEVKTEVEEVKTEVEENITGEKLAAKNISSLRTVVNYCNIKSTEDEEYKRLLEKLRYNQEHDEKEIELEESPELPIDRSKPYNISRDDFEDIEAYESDEYTYYADGYVTDSYGMPMDDAEIENGIGLKFDEYFKDTGEDQIWIRNERLQMDFSVIRDLDKFVDVATPRIKRMVGL